MDRTLCISKNLVHVRKEMTLNNLSENFWISCLLVFTKNVIAKTENFEVILAGNSI